MVSQNTSAALQRQMHITRQDLNEHADQVVETARKKFDWRRYVANHPWTSLAGAAAVGYLLAPRRDYCNRADYPAEAAPSSHHSPVAGIVGGMASMLTTTMMREGAAVFSQLAHQWLQDRRRPPEGSPFANGTENGNGRDG